jgi:ABC-2 type transport system permease protein
VMAALFRTEMAKQWRRRRTYVVFGITALIPIIIAVAVKANPPSLTGAQDPEGRFTAFASETGLFVPVVALQFMSQFLLVGIVALFAGDAIACEASWGNLRAMLTRPIGRGRLLIAKAETAGVLALVTTALIGVTGLIAGTIAFGWHPLNIPFFGPAGHQSQLHVVANLALASGYVLWGIAGVAAFAFMVSTMTDSPAGAVFAGFGLYVVSQILNNISSLDPISFLFPTHDQNAWTALFEGHGPTGAMLDGTLVQIPYVLVFGAVAWWYFRRKDILS